MIQVPVVLNLTTCKNNNAGKKVIFLVFLFFVFSCLETGDNRSNNNGDENTRVEQNLGNKLTNNTFFFEHDKNIGHGESFFIQRITNIVVDDIGRIFITEGAEGRNTIYAFLPDGEHLTTIGRYGEGPGEFHNISNMKIHLNKIYVYDSSLFRLTIFSLNTPNEIEIYNLHSDKWSHIDKLYGYVPSPYHFFIIDNELILWGFVQPPKFNEPNTYRYIRYYILKENGSFNQDQLFKQIDMKLLTGTFQGRPVALYEPFLIKPLIELSDKNNIYSAYSDQFLINIYNLHGDHIQSFHHPFTNIPIDEEKIYRHLEKNWQGELRLNNRLPERWPALEEMLIDDENRLWVSTIVADFDIHEWWVLDGDSGDVITKFEWPRDEPIEVIKNGYMYTLQTDEEIGLQQVVRYRIVTEEV